MPDVKAASASDVIPGADVFEIGDGVVVGGGTAFLDGAEGYSYAMYGLSLPDGAEVTGLGIEVTEVSGGIWVALSDYRATGSWEIHGPYESNLSIPGDAIPLLQVGWSYINAADSFYWAVIAEAGSRARVVSSTVTYELAIPFSPPPDGDQLVENGPAGDPDLLVMPEIPGVSEAGAPAVAYISYQGIFPEARIARYRAGQWRTSAVDPSRSYTQPRLIRDGSGFRLFVYEPAEMAVVEIKLDQELVNQSSTTIYTAAEPNLSGFAVDALYSPGGEGVIQEITLAHAYSGTGASEVRTSSFSMSNGWETGDSIYSGADRVVGISLLYDDESGDPFMVFSHGTIDTTDLPLIDTIITYGPQTSGTWQLSDTDIEFGSDNLGPLLLELGPGPGGGFELVAVAVRDIDLTFPATFRASVLFDVVSGRFDGSAWTFARAFEADYALGVVIPPFPPVEGTLDIIVSPLASWAAPGELSHSVIQGQATFLLETFEPTNSDFELTTRYQIDSGSGYGESGLYTGSNGYSFSWGNASGNRCCAYIKAGNVSLEDILGGNLNLLGDLLYWAE